jgi:hypothetical protein
VNREEKLRLAEDARQRAANLRRAGSSEFVLAMADQWDAHAQQLEAEAS